MRIPRIPTGEYTGKSWSETNPAGKGDEPRNLGEAFRRNYDEAFPGRVAKPGHTRVVFKSDGTKIETHRQ